MSQSEVWIATPSHFHRDSVSRGQSYLFDGTQIEFERDLMHPVGMKWKVDHYTNGEWLDAGEWLQVSAVVRATVIDLESDVQRCHAIRHILQIYPNNKRIPLLGSERNNHRATREAPCN